MYAKLFKRMLDIVLSLWALIMLSPLLLIISALVKADSPGPVFFKQKRVGIHKSYFDMLKFRTMRTDAPKNMPTHLLLNPENYITKVGRFLRTTSLDELPQILHILSGKMSLIGPRPALWNQDDLVAERDKYGANDIRPGLSGWAQINGRDTVEISDKAKFDGEYANNVTLRMDLKCLWGTVVNVLSREGVIEGGTGALHKNEHSAV